ncbi:MAG: TPM domain-containing protein [Bacteroidales bacterium]|jgi:uncharacterized membrane protein|nr:TPM domain-containing protein [Bacteroidales bacterium]MCI1785404.1 TPM domain-containing protein [Bacteroidales bacterium]
MNSRDFLTGEQKKKLVGCIREAEKLTSGEIRVHIDNNCGPDPKEKALKTFHRLGMMKTAERNGVLVYVACQSKKFAVLGDKGINDVVPDHFWKDVCDVLGLKFSSDDYAGGLEEAVLMIGGKLKKYFPYDKNDINELPDDISVADGSDEPSGSQNKK